MSTAGAKPFLRRLPGWLALSAAAVLMGLTPVHAADPPAAKDAGAPSSPMAYRRWERIFYGELQGRSALLYSDSVYYSKLAFGDLDGDGRPDLLVGKADGRIDRFENVGTPEAPRWHLVEENIRALRPGKSGKGAPTEVIDVGSHAAPALVDIDQDGDLDLFVGSGDGRLAFYRNVGNPRLPAFALVTRNFLGKGFGRNLVPVFADVDHNRAPDLFLGNLAGDVYLLINQGTARAASFCTEFPRPDALPDEAPPCTPTPQRIASIAPETNASPGVVDWDGDGDLDLFVGKSNGTIDYFQNKGTGTHPDWWLEQRHFLAIDDGGFAAPAFIDINGDGKPDMVVGSSSNNVPVYTYLGTGNPLDVWKLTNNLLNIHHFSRDLRQAVITAGDLEGDGLLDLIVGSQDGHLIWLKNVGSRTRPAWRVKEDHMLSGVTRDDAAPCLVDIDGDGDLDLLVGGADGRLWLLRNIGTPKHAKFALETTNFAGISVGSDSVPVAFDADGDGDPDLFIGNRAGTVVYYRNDGTRTAPDFHLADPRLGSLRVPLRAAPAFVDWDGDGKPDLVVGSRRGGLTLALNDNDKGDSTLKNWKVVAGALSEFKTAGYSAPLFADLNGDGKPDLLIGDAEGNVQFWVDHGRPPPPPPPEKASQGAATTASQGTASQAPSAAAAPATSESAPVAAVPLQQQFESQSGLTSLLPPSPESGSAGGGAEGVGQGANAHTGPLPPVFTLATRELGGIKVKGRLRPTFGDLNGDGLIDLVVGTANGHLVYYRNEGTKAVPKFVKVNDDLGGFKNGDNPSPLLYDLDGDGLLDLVVGTEGGQVRFLRNTGTKTAPAFTLQKDALSNIHVGRYAAPAAGFVTQAKKTDLLVGDFTGNVSLYEREDGAHSLNFRLIDRRFLGIDVGVAATPFVGDIDKDGHVDLLVGSDQGQISLFQQVKPDASHPEGWAPGADYLRGLKFPFGTSPRLVDIDGDGDMDLLTGSERGTLYLYRNDALNPPSGPSQ